MVSAWHEAVGLQATANWLTVGDLKGLAGGAHDKAGALSKAFMEVAAARTGGEISGERLGRWLTRNKNRVACGYAITGRRDDRTKQQVWCLRDHRNP